jgi:hypothetical protein
MIGDVQADEFALPVEHLALVNIFYFGQGDLFDDACDCAEETHLPRICGAEVIAADGDDAIERGEHGGAVAEQIERANFDETFKRAFANGA